MEFRVLGPLEVVIDGITRPIGGPKPRALLAALLVAAGEPLSREQLIDELWGLRPPATAANTLQVNVAALRRTLGGLLRSRASGYLLDAEPAMLDSHQFELMLQAASSGDNADPGSASRNLSAALGLWRGRAFADVPGGEIVRAAAARLDEMHLGAIEDRAEADLALGRHGALVAELTGRLAAHPTRERLAGQLMLALHRCGRSADGLAVFEETCRVLDRQLGVDPGDALSELSRAIHRADPILAAPGPPSLPAPLSRFIGRSEELRRAGDLLAGARLLTLTGVGGSGKTRLGLELARQGSGSYPGGVHLVDLATLAPGTSVAGQVAAALGVREVRGASVSDLVETRLRHHRTLLMLDNCEHVVSECADLCSQILDGAPGLRILATTREPLGIPGEVVFTVPGLEHSDAVRLLVDRIMAASPGFALAAGEPTIAEALCRRLDGLPLAIELAAARVRNLSLREVATRVEERLDVLAGSRSADARHRTMRASIEWSHEMLDEAEQITQRRLSVFSGRFSPYAAAAVAGGWAPLPDTANVVDLCGRLVDKSMLVALPGSEHTGYRLLETVRQFAAERLAVAGEVAAARTRHADWYHDQVPTTAEWAGPEQVVLMDRMRREIDNFHSALGWYLGDGWDPERALAMAAPMWSFWYMAGRVGEGRTWLNRVLAAGPADPTRLRGQALRSAAALARIIGDFPEAVRLGQESLGILRFLGDEAGIVAALNNLCITSLVSGDLDAARGFGEEGLAIIERRGDSHGYANAKNNLGLVERIAGDLDKAGDLFRAGLETYRATNDRRGTAAALTNLAIVGRRRGQTGPARVLAVDALRLYTELGFGEGQVDCLEVIAAIAADEGDCAEAMRLLTVAGRERDELRTPLFASDEVAQVQEAQATARAGLSAEELDRILAEAADLPLAEAVAAVLGADHPQRARD